jgi:hypothetical protein
MTRRRMTCRGKQPNKWTATDWERSWEVALRRIADAPSRVTAQRVFQESLLMLDTAFADGNSARFERGLIALLDVCAEAVNLGECEQWW